MDKQIIQKLDDFFTQFKHQSFKKGEMLIRADEDPLGVYYLTKGKVKQYAISKKGDELVINIFKPKSFFPMSWAINQTPNSYYFEALDDSEIWRAPRDKTINFIKSNPDITFDLMSRVFKGTDGIFLRLVYLMSGEAYTRVISEILITAKRFGNKIDSRSIELKISEKDLASQVGMTRETVSREIQILKNRGLIAFKKHKILIEDITKLENELTQES